MFGRIFGEYLVNQQYLSEQQLKEVLSLQENSRAKIGKIAVAEKMLTEEEAEKINHIQAREDRRFGDIAVEKKLLTGFQVEKLLSLQGSPYHTFMEVLTGRAFMSEVEANRALAQFQSQMGYTKEALEAIKSGNADRILPLFLHSSNIMEAELAGVAMRTVLRLIDTRAVPSKSMEKTAFPFSYFAMQNAMGDHNILFGIAGDEKGMLAVASGFGREQFEQMDEDAFDSVCEFVNCINGLYASALSGKNVQVDMVPPNFYTAGSINSDKAFCAIPVKLHEEEITLLIAVDCDVTIETP